MAHAVASVPSRVVAGFQHGEWNPYGRYFMVRLSDAHAWVEVTTRAHGFSTRQAKIAFFIVHRNGSNDQRIEGELTPEEIDMFIQDLQRIKIDLAARQAFIDANQEYEQRNRQWEQARDEFARQRVREFQKAQK